MTPRAITAAIAMLSIAASVVSGCGIQADAQSWLTVRDERTVSRTLRFGGGGSDRVVDLRTIHGSIRVTAADRPDVQLDARRTVRARSQADVERAEREVTLEVLDDASRVGAVVRDPASTVCGEPWNDRRSWRRQDYVVEYEFAAQVPRRTNLRLCTVNGGQVDVDGIEGEFDISNVNGGITIRSARGTGNAETVNGLIVATFLESPKSEMRLKTLNGNVDATFPAALSADVLLKTFNGNLWTDFDVQYLPRQVQTADRRSGRFSYKSDGSARVRIGNGGPTIAIETFNGDVRVLKAAR